MMGRASWVILISISCCSAAGADNYDDWKAPPPQVSLEDPPAPRAMPKHHALVNEVVEAENLPYLRIKGYHLKVAISREILNRYMLKSGAEITAELMYEIIDADKEFQKGVLR